MENQNEMSRARQFDEVDEEINLIDLIYPLYKRRRFLILFCVLSVAAVGIISIAMPKTYEATAVILPEAKQGTGSELKAAFLEQFGISGLGATTATPAEVFESVLKSRELARGVLSRYNYFHIMGIDNKSRQKVIDGFAKSVKVKKGRKEPTLSVSIDSHDPTVAADLANTYIVELDKYNRTNMVTSAQRLRKYIEERLQAANAELELAQQELRKFQEQNRAISISKQAEATLKVLSELEARRVALEVQKAAKEKFYRGQHLEIEQLNAQMEAIQKNINRLTYSEEPRVPVEREKGKVEFYIPLTCIPALNFDESRLLLKVKAKTGVVTMLTTQLEQAKLDEARDMPTINVLDRAHPPERPIKPRLKLNILLGAVVALFLGIFLIFFLEYTHRVGQDPETSPKWQEIKDGLTGTISFFKKFRK
ncbi:MAG: hypothetical protein JRI41_07920 [Deltaproteobacteria bacterium]|nr:hypothetical protein [Deltaproteobacteria bacterium]RLC07496.1 MAG: hypothetical protein DRH43_11670 [Deltaproteobacteria bacterium]